MKNYIFVTFLGMLLLASCQEESDNTLNANVIFLDPGPCCSNMELINREPIFSDLAGYSETILAAVNINDFSDLNIEDGDSINIQFEFSELVFDCVPNVICNRHNGIPIELISLEKL